jgi:hypothetical protein
MGARRARQPLAYDVRLPDEAQAEALRLLDASRAVVNQALALLWPCLDAFGARTAGPACKLVGQYLSSPQPHGDRQWRCEREVVGRVLRQQAQRTKAFALVIPILSDGLLRATTDNTPAGKNRRAITEAIASVQQRLDDEDTSFMALQNVLEQACNSFLPPRALSRDLRGDATRPPAEGRTADLCRRRWAQDGASLPTGGRPGGRGGTISLSFPRCDRGLAVAHDRGCPPVA